MHVGVDPVAYLAADGLTRRLLDRAIERAFEIEVERAELRDRNLAVRIANALGRMLG